MVKSLKVRTGSDALATTKENSKHESPIEHEYDLCQWSPSSDISFGWEEVPAHTRAESGSSSYESEEVDLRNVSASECTRSNERMHVTIQGSNSNESVESEHERDVGVTTTNEESKFRDDSECVSHLALKSVVSESLGSSNFRMSKTPDRITVGHVEELAYPQTLAGNLAKDSCKKKETHVSESDHCRSDSSDQSVEIPSLLKDEEYGLVKVRCGLEIESLTDEEEIWIVQCPISLNPQDLENEELVFGGTSALTLKLEDLEKYEAVSYSGRNKPVSCLLPSREKGSLKAKVLQPEGLLVITEKVDVPEVNMAPSKQRTIQTPTGLRVRHPLFGYDYKEELRVRTEFANQQRTVLHEGLVIQPKRIKKEKKREDRDADTCNDRREWQTYDEWEQECHNNKNKTKKSKKKYDKEHKKKKKDKHMKND